MSELRSGLRRVRDGLPEPSTRLDDVFDLTRRRHRARRVGTAVFAFVLFAGAATGAWLAFRSSSPPPAPSDERVLPASLGGQITQIVAVEGSVWASVWTGTSEDDLSGDIVRLNADTGEEIARIHLDEAGAIAVGGGAAWVTNLRGQSITRIDLGTNEVTGVFPLPDLAYEVAEGDAAFIPNDVAYSAGRIWVSTARGSVYALDGDGVLQLRYDGDPADMVDRIVPSKEGVWAVLSTFPPEARLLDPITAQPMGTEELRGPTVDVAAGPDGTWTLSGFGADCEGGEDHGCISEDEPPAARELFSGTARGDQRIVLIDRPAAIAVGEDDVFIAMASGEILRATRNDGPRSTIRERAGDDGNVLDVTDLAVLGDELWVAAGDQLLVLPTEPNKVTQEPSQTGEPTTGPTGTDSLVPEGACAFPAYMPTYLPWLGSTEGTRLARPDMSRTYEGGGPQGLDPGYSMVSWSADEGRFGVTLWRATQSAGDGGTDPDVPPLPDGSTGRFYLSEGDESISIIWNDAIPETHDDGCGETTLVVGWSGATERELRAEAAKVAESLRPYDWEATWPPSSDDGAFAIWPVDTPEEAVADQVGFVDPEILALTFGNEVLGWPGCRVVAEHPVKTLEGQAPVTHMILEVERDPQGPTVEVEVAELLPGQWFVTAVYGTKVTVSVTHDGTDWTLEVTYDGPDVAGGMVDVRVGYGTDGREAANRAIMDGSGTGSVTVDLGGLQTNMPGNVVILFYDASGAYVAQAFALAPGETTVSAG